jgi:hypothetical protein
LNERENRYEHLFSNWLTVMSRIYRIVVKCR